MTSSLIAIPHHAFDNTVLASDDGGQSFAEIDPVNVADKNFVYEPLDFATINGMTVGYANTSRPAYDVYEAYNAPPIEIIWSDFRFEEIPDNTDIKSVKVKLITADLLMGDPDTADATYEWKLVTANDVVLAEGSAVHVDCLDREIFVELEELNTEDFQFRDQGAVSTTKLTGGVFNKSDLVGAKLKYKVTNETPYDPSFFNTAMTMIDVVNVDVVFTVIKPYIRGYVDRKGRPTIPANGQPICKAFVIKKGPSYPDGSAAPDGVQWQWVMSDVAATKTAAEQAIAGELLFAQNNGLKAKLRVFNPQPSTINATVPAITHNGSGTLPTGTQGGTNCATGQQFNTAGFTVPYTRFWHDPQFIEAYGELQTYLAGKFDSNPALCDVAFMGGTTKYAEPMIHNINGDDDGRPGIDYRRAQVNTWQAAGSPNTNYYTSDVAALKALMDKHLVWETTPQSLACNPYQKIDVTTCNSFPRYLGNNDLDITLELAQYWCEILGKRAIVGNNSIRPISPNPTATYDAMYEGLVDICEATGADMYFQTAGNAPMEDSAGTFDEALDATIVRCKQYGAIYVELPSDYTRTDVTVPPF